MDHGTAGARATADIHLEYQGRSHVRRHGSVIGLAPLLVKHSLTPQPIRGFSPNPTLPLNIYRAFPTSYLRLIAILTTSHASPAPTLP
jgi:hypothetical protein